MNKTEKQIRKECIEEILKVFDSKQLIGNVSRKFEDMKQRDYDWKSFYTGWMEGRVRMLERLRDSLEKMSKQKYAELELESFWDYLCSELGILEDQEKQNVIREFGRLVRNQVKDGIIVKFEN